MTEGGRIVYNVNVITLYIEVMYIKYIYDVYYNVSNISVYMWFKRFKIVFGLNGN